MDKGSIRLKIDGKEVSASDGETILDVAKRYGIEIPTLCHLEGLSAFGGCRLCIVEIKGSTKLFAACTTPVAPGMDVVTDSPRLKEYRKMIIELLLSESTHVCAMCVANGNCELQELAQKLGVDHSRFNRRWTGYKVDSSHDRLVLDPNRCILCTRCIRVCDEIEGVHALDLKMRGKDSQLIVDLDDPWAYSESCTSCGKCAKVCPVGAIYIKGEPLSSVREKNLPSFILERRKR